MNPTNLEALLPESDGYLSLEDARSALGVAASHLDELRSTVAAQTAAIERLKENGDSQRAAILERQADDLLREIDEVVSASDRSIREIELATTEAELLPVSNGQNIRFDDIENSVRDLLRSLGLDIDRIADDTSRLRWSTERQPSTGVASYRTSASRERVEHASAEDRLSEERTQVDAAHAAILARSTFWLRLAYVLLFTGSSALFALLASRFLLATSLDAAAVSGILGACLAFLGVGGGIFKHFRSGKLEQCQIEIRRRASERSDGLLTAVLVHDIEQQFGSGTYSSALNELCKSGEVRAHEGLFYYHRD